MAILKMKHLRLLGMQADRDELLRRFQLMGCVEIAEADWQTDADWGQLTAPSGDRTAQRLKDRWDDCISALSVLNRYAPDTAKKPLFSPKPSVTVEELFSEETLNRAEQAAAELNALEARIRRYSTEDSRLEALIAALEPWSSLDLPLDFEGTVSTAAVFGTMPAGLDPETVSLLLEEEVPASHLITAHRGSDLDSVVLICHRSAQADALNFLRGLGFSLTGFKDQTGTAAWNIQVIQGDRKAVQNELQRMQESVRDYAHLRADLQLAGDRLEQELARAEHAQRILNTGTVFALEGWIPAEQEPALTELLGQHLCCWELQDPTPEEYPEVPVKLKNNILTQPLNMVTEMYVYPAYDGLDPNPLMAPFFILFFGIMMADMAYGLLMLLGGWLLIKKLNAKGTMGNMGGLLLLCGTSTFLFGALTGGFFGDFIPQIIKLIDPASTFEMPCLFSPLNDTLAILIGSLALGVIQIITGMIISIVYKIRTGDFIDALFGEIAWFVIFAGAALAVVGIGSVAGVPAVLVVGILMLLVGGTRQAKGFGKVTSAIGIVYNGVTGYFSDILSYARIMALMLSGSVIASVFNTLGSVTGNVIGFVVVSLIGNTINLALNLLGCYVHDLRLQCLEFFGRFYKEGGRPFAPLNIKTKYVDMIEQ